MLQFIILLLISVPFTALTAADGTNKSSLPTRVFIFAGQSNMEGADSHTDAIRQFPPFAGLEHPQDDVRFSYCIGRQNKHRSNAWVPLSAVNHMVGPELSFAREVKKALDAPIAIIKCAAGGTHLGGDWNPDEPSGFEMYPLALDLVRTSLADLESQGINYQIEAFVWHQGENDMFNEDYMANYGKNLARFIERWREDLKTPDLPFFIGELCTKTIWGMDLRPRMYAISRGQKAVTEEDPRATYVRTSHIGVEIGNPAGLHYHYGTLGQLEHGLCHARAYLASVGISQWTPKPLTTWPIPDQAEVKLFVFAGHRNMEGERAFIQNVPKNRNHLLNPAPSVPFRYSLGGGYLVSEDWEALRPGMLYDNFGPELSFVDQIKHHEQGSIAAAKFTHGGSQLNDWTPEGSLAKSRHLYPNFIDFIKNAISDLEARGHRVRLAGIFYHLGENETSMFPYRKQMIAWLKSLIQESRIDLQYPTLKWHVSQQPPTDHKNVNEVDVVAALATLAKEDRHLYHIFADRLPPQEKRLVLNTEGIIELGNLLAKSYLAPR